MTDSRPFTAAVCRGPVCDATCGKAVVDGLRDSIRRHPHAVLVSMGCPLGPVSCHAIAARRQGAVVVVQNCTEQRHPAGPAVWIGPVTGPDDVAEVRRWLDNGTSGSARLPAHLRLVPPSGPPTTN